MTKATMIISSDKCHYYGHIRVKRPSKAHDIYTIPRDDKYSFFNACFDTAMTDENLSVKFSCDIAKNGKLIDCILDKFSHSLYANDEGLVAYVEQCSTRRLNNTYQRVRRAFQKVHIHHETNSYFNYFMTQTYNPDLFSSEADFVRKFKKCLQNFATRRGWRYILKEERGSDTDRLHFHALIHIPYGQLTGGTIYKSTPDKHNHWRRNYRHENDFFLENFGINDFEQIANEDLKPGGEVIGYIVKYCLKDNTKITYSRGLIDVITAVIDLDSDVALIYEENNLTKYLLFDNMSPYADHMNRHAVAEEQRLDNLIYMHQLGLLEHIRAS